MDSHPIIYMLLFSTLSLILTLGTVASNEGGVFDVMSYGAKGDGKVDDSKAFLSAWSAACSYSQGESTMLIPEGSYLVGPLLFQGYCSQNVTVLLKGDLVASSTNHVNESDCSQKNWIEFKCIDGLNITGGGGGLDARGPSARSSNDYSRENCTNLPKTLVLRFVRNASIYNISSINGEFFHMNVLYGSKEMTFDSVVGITALEDSPNRDDDIRTLLEQLYNAGLEDSPKSNDNIQALLEMTTTFYA